MGGSQLTKQETRELILFCDFDGTITLSDNIVALMTHFNPPGWETIVQDIIASRKSLRIGVGEMFALFPSSMKEEITQYVLQTAGIRPGFRELLDWCSRTNTEFYVTSGGIDFFVYPILASFDIQPDHIYCNGSSFTGAAIQILWPHPCDEACHADCGMCKTRVIRGYDASRYYRVLIGDSLTDFEGAKLVDHVFARSHLLTRCQETELPHTPYETFFDVIEGLRQLPVKKGKEA